MKTTLNYNDYDHSQAVNYDGRNYYNSPITLTAKGIKYILSAGTSDQIRIKTKAKGMLYIITENSGLDYISLTVIDTKEKTVLETFHGNEDLSHNNSGLKRSIFDYSTNYQIRVLSAYL